MSDNAVHTVPSEGAWINEIAARQVGEQHPTQAEAVDAARVEAIDRHIEHHIHDRSGLLTRTDGYEGSGTEES